MVGIIGLMSALATPMLLRYYEGAQLRIAAEQVATFLNQGRQLAITQNGSSVCTSPRRQCTTIWAVARARRGSGPAPTPRAIRGAGGHHPFHQRGDPVFNYLGGVTTGVTYTINHTQSSTLVHVVVAVSGRVSITP